MFCGSNPQKTVVPRKAKSDRFLKVKRRIRQHTTLKQDFVVWLNTQDPVWSGPITHTKKNVVTFEEKPCVRRYLSHTGCHHPRKRCRRSIVGK